VIIICDDMLLRANKWKIMHLNLSPIVWNNYTIFYHLGCTYEHAPHVLWCNG